MVSGLSSRFKERSECAAPKPRAPYGPPRPPQPPNPPAREQARAARPNNTAPAPLPAIPPPVGRGLGRAASVREPRKVEPQMNTDRPRRRSEAREGFGSMWHGSPDPWSAAPPPLSLPVAKAAKAFVPEPEIDHRFPRAAPPQPRQVEPFCGTAEHADTRRSGRWPKTRRADTGDGIASRGGAETAEGSNKRKGLFLRALRGSACHYSGVLSQPARVIEANIPEKRGFAEIVLRRSTDVAPPDRCSSVWICGEPIPFATPRVAPPALRISVHLRASAVPSLPAGAHGRTPAFGHPLQALAGRFCRQRRTPTNPSVATPSSAAYVAGSGTLS